MQYKHLYKKKKKCYIANRVVRPLGGIITVKSKYVIVLLIVFLLGSITGAGAFALCNAKNILYSPTDDAWDIDTVDDALNDLYNACVLGETPGDGTGGWNDGSGAGAPIVSKDLVPVLIASDGVVTYANTSEKWYDYENKEWANAVILVDSPSKTYNIGDTIIEDDIESYFVWIPRYRYKLFHANQADGIETQSSGNIAQEIEIEFESKDIPASNGTQDGEWLTHPAFTNFDVNGIWVGKFETGYKGSTDTSSAQVSSSDPTKIQIKPNVYSWRDNSVGNFFKAMYNYNRDLDSHMMKNTEWGAVAYLSHSRYGINTEVRINNHSNYLTGYAANTKDAGQSTTANQPYNTETGYLASTTGNITGVYDMSGGAYEYVAGYRDGTVGSSGLTLTEIRETYSRYVDVYASNSSVTTYSKRILGDATGELGPFNTSHRNNWYDDFSNFVESSLPWFYRGGAYSDFSRSGQFAFIRGSGGNYRTVTARLVLLG